MKPMTRARGFTLIEVLVTFLVIALGLLGLAALQVNTINNGFEAYQRAIAAALVDDMAERLRMNPAGVRAGAYVPHVQISPNDAGVCSMDLLASTQARVNQDQCEWQRMIDGSSVLDGGVGIGGPRNAEGCVSALSSSVVRVSISWVGMTPVAKEFEPFETCFGGDNPDPYRRVVFRDVAVRQGG